MNTINLYKNDFITSTAATALSTQYRYMGGSVGQWLSQHILEGHKTTRVRFSQDDESHRHVAYIKNQYFWHKPFYVAIKVSIEGTDQTIYVNKRSFEKRLLETTEDQKTSANMQQYIKELQSDVLSRDIITNTLLPTEQRTAPEVPVPTIQKVFRVARHALKQHAKAPQSLDIRHIIPLTENELVISTNNQLGEGGFKKVTEAIHLIWNDAQNTFTQKNLAILTRAPKCTPEELEYEAAILTHYSKRSAYTHIVKTIACPKINGSTIIIQERYGPNILKFLQANKNLRLLQKYQIAKQMLQALKEFHLGGYVHNDIKLENFFINTDPSDRNQFHVVLADFGFALKPGENRKGGTPLYFSPERLARPTTQASTSDDICSLGYAFWQLFENNLEMPWQKQGANPGSRVLFPRGPTTASNDSNGDYLSALHNPQEKIVYKMTRFHPMKRATIYSLIHDLEQLIQAEQA